MDRARMDGLTNAGVLADGDVTLTNVSISGGADGVRVGPAGSATIFYATIVESTGIGIDNSQGGTVTLTSSIVFDSAVADLNTVPCAAVSYSDTGTPDCSAMNGNLSAGPQVDATFHLIATSPCLDSGPDPATYNGTPWTDLEGGPRLRDARVREPGADTGRGHEPPLARRLRRRHPAVGRATCRHRVPCLPHRCQGRDLRQLRGLR
jgi:hypothetical protein